MSITTHLMRLCVALALAGFVTGGAEASPVYHDFPGASDGFAHQDASDIGSLGRPIGGFVRDAGRDHLVGKFFHGDETFESDGDGTAVRGYFEDDGLLFSISGTGHDLVFDGEPYGNWADESSGVAVATDAPARDSSGTLSEPATLLLLAAMFAVFLTMSGGRNRR
ncbi:MAG: hypothetical protein ACREFQ_12400 [Stellaceae bacterium]